VKKQDYLVGDEYLVAFYVLVVLLQPLHLLAGEQSLSSYTWPGVLQNSALTFSWTWDISKFSGGIGQTGWGTGQNGLSIS
jgi:hypothetical protein